ncbi:hypothetical protein E3N88_42440 [Mikania micrantha]|uniref:Uncharacterized protein n=1 Tax=Mikania micrantha TaxID=192012 RepID=A0A5N6LIM9_9ASTR|nr:hypothetical protein E3N88_42440 [Mikania micrantha]
MAIEGTLELENGNGGIKNGENLVDADEDDAGVSVEMTFSDIMIPSWKEQLTFRAFVVSAMLGVMFSFIVMKLNLTTGMIPSLNMVGGVLGFLFVKTWTKGLEQCGMLKHPFTRQENTMNGCKDATSFERIKEEFKWLEGYNGYCIHC